MRRLPLLAASLLTVSLALAGCSGDDTEKKKEASETPTPTATTAAALHSPLTGAEVKKLPNHPVMVVKIDNVAQAAPQQGVGDADMVVEELVEGGVTRLASFYYSTLPENVGPVRSMRTSDINIVAPLQAKIITSGAAPETIAALQEAKVEFFQEGAKGFTRDSSQWSAPHNLFADAKEIGGGLAVADSELQPYFEFGDTAGNPKGKQATSLQAHFGSRTTEWSFTDGAWVNTNSFQSEESTFEPTSVVALEVEVTDAGYGGYNGAFVPESHLLGTGKAWIFDGNRVIEGTWTKKKAGDTIVLTQGKKKISVPVGKTYVELVPHGEGGVTWAK